MQAHALRFTTLLPPIDEAIMVLIRRDRLLNVLIEPRLQTRETAYLAQRTFAVN
jgi:hypothetical protein